MLGQKKRYYKVFSQFIPTESRILYFSHYYSITAVKKPEPAVRTLGGIVSVFQYTDTAEEAAALMSSMFGYTSDCKSADKAFLLLPQNPNFNGGQQNLF